LTKDNKDKQKSSRLAIVFITITVERELLFICCRVFGDTSKYSIHQNSRFFIKYKRMKRVSMENLELKKLLEERAKITKECVGNPLIPLEKKLKKQQENRDGVPVSSKKQS